MGMEIDSGLKERMDAGGAPDAQCSAASPQPSSAPRAPAANRRARCGVGGVLGALALGLAAHAAAQTPCPLTLTGGAGGVREFTVELAESPAEQARGLMGRETLDAAHGMLFVMPIARQTAMWMKDTLIPLDMVFFDGAGRAVHVERHTDPGSLRHVGPATPVRYVLEVNAGEAQGIEPGGAWALDVAGLAECLAVRASTVTGEADGP